MVIGQSGKPEDIELNVCKTKKLTNTRSSGADEALKLTPPKIMSLEQCLEFIDTRRASGGYSEVPPHPEKDPGFHAEKESFLQE